MKISYITPVYKDVKHLKKFLGAFSTQTKQLFELILVIDAKEKKILNIIDDAPSKLQKKIRVIYNSKRMGRNNAITYGVNIASGDYSMILSLGNIFGDKMVENTINIINEKKGVDIIEFKAKFKTPIKFDGKIRKMRNNSIELEGNSKFVAYSYPFDFNKIFKTQVLLEASQLTKMIEVNSKFSIKYAYLPFYVAKTYATTNKTLIVAKSTLSSNFNPLLINRQWNSLIEYDSKNKDNMYNSEFMYAKMFHQLVFMYAFVGTSKNKVLLQKQNKLYKDGLKHEFENFFTDNKYMLSDNEETDLITDNYTLTNLTKFFKRING